MNLKCKICNKTFSEYFSLSKHLTTIHKMSIKEKEEYYLLYINNNADVLCPHCDFYIESLDLYIEINAHWTHGSHAFEGTPEDLEILKQWRSKQSKYYNNAIAVWTKRDVEKRDLAKKNNINYIEIFSNRQNIIIDEIREWING